MLSFSARHLASTETPYTCNCLLPGSPPQPSSPPPPPSPASLFSASYELLPGTQNHVGDVRRLRLGGGSEAATSAGTAPAAGGDCSVSTACVGERWSCGVFDLVWHCRALPSGAGEREAAAAQALSSPSTGPAAAAAVVESGELYAACTDGGVRVLDPATLRPRRHYAPLHANMLTSVTVMTSGGGGDGDAQESAEGGAHAGEVLLCTAHGGDVLLYDGSRGGADGRRLLAAHEYDAWCGAALGPRAAATGGDDGVLLLHDLRAPPSAAAAAGRSRPFDAGVVSICPVYAAGDSNSDGDAGHLLWVGDYSESLSLVDTRALRRGPVAQRRGLGGGVWRVSRCLPVWGGGGGALGLAAGAGVFVLPLMQGGAALLPHAAPGAAAESEMFPQEPLYLYEAAGGRSTGGGAGPRLTEQTLVYDTAVLGCVWEGAEEGKGAGVAGTAALRATLASCSFYEKRIDVWEVLVGAGDAL